MVGQADNRVYRHHSCSDRQTRKRATHAKQFRSEPCARHQVSNPGYSLLWPTAPSRLVVSSQSRLSFLVKGGTWAVSSACFLPVELWEVWPSFTSYHPHPFQRKRAVAAGITSEETWGSCVRVTRVRSSRPEAPAQSIPSWSRLPLWLFVRRPRGSMSHTLNLFKEPIVWQKKFRPSSGISERFHSCTLLSFPWAGFPDRESLKVLCHSGRLRICKSLLSPVFFNRYFLNLSGSSHLSL